MPLTTRHLTTTIGGRIDRLDRIVRDGQEQIRVIDYKTGNRERTSSFTDSRPISSSSSS